MLPGQPKEHMVLVAARTAVSRPLFWSYGAHRKMRKKETGIFKHPMSLQLEIAKCMTFLKKCETLQKLLQSQAWCYTLEIPTTGRLKAGGSEVQGQPQLHSKVEASLGYMTPYFKE